MSRVSQPELKRFLEKRVLINVQGGRKIQGTLRGYDLFLNLVVDDAVEQVQAENNPHLWKDGAHCGTVVRCAVTLTPGDPRQQRQQHGGAGADYYEVRPRLSRWRRTHAGSPVHALRRRGLAAAGYDIVPVKTTGPSCIMGGQWCLSLAPLARDVAPLVAC